jgi:hypothetical protein
MSLAAYGVATLDEMPVPVFAATVRVKALPHAVAVVLRLNDATPTS